jgi:RNA polymerase sigma-54 factor
MKTSLQLRLGQQLTMTPQLQQAIRLLQLSSLELQTEVQQALESNPLLEQSEGEEEQEHLTIHDLKREIINSEDNELNASLRQETIPEELLVDASWSDIYDSLPLPTASGDEFLLNLDNQGNREETLQEHLLWQAHLASSNEKDFAIAASIIDAINEEGYLCSTLEEIAQSLEKDIEVELSEVEVILHQIQNFDPPGVGASNLGECLLLQLRHYPSDTPWLEAAKQLISQHLVALGKRDYTQVMRAMKLSEQELHSVIHLIQSLNPRPGDQIQPSKTEYVVPDIYVTKCNGCWQVELNPEIAPRLRVNNHYASLIRRADDSLTNSYLKNQLQEARWFLKSLHSRNETLLKAACCIVERQQAFLEYGDEAMRPLVLHDVAEAVSMHESTISRVTTNKYMHTPRGIYELKYFFSSHVATNSGGECSATAIRAFIKKLIAAEEPRKPLSDNKIAQSLAEQGIKVARRTIAKYRESLNIPPSNERKRLI